MAALTWNGTGERLFETGVDRGVFYPPGGTGVAWLGLTSVTETVSGGEHKPVYVDGKKNFDLIQSEDFQAEVEAFSSPAAFAAYDGIVSLAPGLFATQQPRQAFNFCYRTVLGNDVKSVDYSYKIHLVYNATATPSERSNKTQSDKAELMPLKWTFHTTPPASVTFKPAAHLVVNVALLTAAKRTALENLLYGTSSSNPTFPTQSALISLLSAA